MQLSMKISIPIYTFLFLSGCNIKQPDQNNIDQYNRNLKLPVDAVFLSKTFAFNRNLDSLERLPLKYISDTLVNCMECLINRNVDSIVYYKDAALVFDNSGQVNGLYEYEPGLTKFLNVRKIDKDSTIDSRIGIIKIKRLNFIKIDAAKKLIIDNFDTMQIVDHWPKKKFILVDARKSTNPQIQKTPFSHFNTIIYSYK